MNGLDSAFGPVRELVDRIRFLENQRDGLLSQVREFREKCDPTEEMVLVTQWEMIGTT